MKLWIAVTYLVFISAVAQDWPDHGGDRGGSRFSPLTQINRDNVHQLEPVWSFRTGDGEGPMQLSGSYGLQATPILLPAEAGGHLVLCGAYSQVFASAEKNANRRDHRRDRANPGQRRI